MIDTQYQKEANNLKIYITVGVINIIVKIGNMIPPFVYEPANRYMASKLYFTISSVDCVLNSFLILYVIVLSIRLLVKAKYNYFYAY